MVASAQSDTSTWVRLDHHSLGMPVPAVFMPLSDLIGLDLVRLSTSGAIPRLCDSASS